VKRQVKEKIHTTFERYLQRKERPTKNKNKYITKQLQAKSHTNVTTNSPSLCPKTNYINGPQEREKYLSNIINNEQQ
jgi:hypothetical protein